MHFKQLEVFVSVVRLKSFSKTAVSMFLSQPTVSAYIRSLEDELGAKLVVRSTKEAIPTEAGKIFYKYAMQMMDLREAAEFEVRSYATKVQGSLEIAASTAPSQYLIPKVIGRLSAKYPGLTFAVKEYDSVEVVRRIADMDAEVGVTGAMFEKNGCDFEAAANDRLQIITPNTPRYAALNGIMTPEVIKSSRFVAREYGSGTRKRSELFLKSIGIEPQSLKTAVTLESTESVIQAVKNDLGISIVSKYACSDCLSTGQILAFDYDSPVLDRHFYTVVRKNRPLSPAAVAFMKAFREEFDR